MATASAFGFSGFDPLGSAAEHLFGNLAAAQGFAWNGKDLRRNVRFQKKMLTFQSQLNRQNQLWSAKNMPLATVAGLRAANLNPLLAYSDFSGLASSGAMGVSPSSYSAATDFSPSGSGSSSFDPAGFDSALSFLGSGRQRRENKKLLESITSQELGTRGDIADIDRELAPLIARAKSGKDLYDLHADAIASRNRAKREALTSYMLDRETDAVTGRFHVHVNSDAPLASDDMNEFWNDYYREKQSGEKWRNSAKRQFILDGLEGANSLFNLGKDTADIWSGVKGVKKGKMPKHKMRKRRH